MRLVRLAIISCLLTISATPGGAQEIERIEPPFRWTGVEHRELQLKLHGNNTSLLTPDVDHAGVSNSRVVRVESPNYLFVYLDIRPDAEPGTFDIAFSEGDYTSTRSYELRRKNPDSDHARRITSADAI